MQLLMIMASSLLLVHSALAWPYQNVRQCRSYTEPCISLGCGTTQSSGIFPHRHTYGCCLGKVFDETRQVCVKTSSGVTSLRSCNPCTEFQCGSGECQLAHWRCDYIKSCLDGSDEIGCGYCGSNYFRCRNGKCVDKKFVCDKENNCGDGSDESFCLTPSGGKCGFNSYRCNNNKCIWLHKVCDGYNHCGDSSDEQYCWRSGKKRSMQKLKKFDDAREKNKTEEANTEPNDAAEPPILIKN